MDLRCLIGHDYGEIETSRDRRQRGNEVVVTVREYRECARCGHQRVLSENKEVTADAGTDELEEPEEPEAEATWSGGDDDPGDAAAEPEATFSRSSVDEPLSAEEDDGVILEDEPEAPRRAHGAWPAADEGSREAAPAADPEPWPDADAPEPAAPSAEELDEDPPTEPEPAAPPPRPDPSDTELVCPDCGETWRSVNASLRPGDICPECRRGYLDEQVIQ